MEDKIFIDENKKLQITGSEEFQTLVCGILFGETEEYKKQTIEWIEEHKNTIFFDKLKELLGSINK